MDGIFEPRTAQIAAVTEQFRKAEQDANVDVMGKLRAALAKLEAQARVSYETLKAIRQAELDSTVPKPKRAKLSARKAPAPASSTKQFLETKAAEQAAERHATASGGPTDVEATLHEVLDESMESTASAASVDATMSCLMAVVGSEAAAGGSYLGNWPSRNNGTVQANAYLPPQCPDLEPLERVCTCWGQSVPFCIRCKIGLAEAAAADAGKLQYTDEVCHRRSGAQAQRGVAGCAARSGPRGRCPSTDLTTSTTSISNGFCEAPSGSDHMRYRNMQTTTTMDT